MPVDLAQALASLNTTEKGLLTPQRRPARSAEAGIGLINRAQQNGIGDARMAFNNPGNVERSQAWAGSLVNRGYGEKDTERFAIFASPVMGVRALARDMRTKIKSTKGNLSEIISKYAPSIENDTKGYREFVSSFIGKDEEGKDRTVTNADLPAIIKAIIKFENTKEKAGYYLDNPEVIAEGILLSRYDLPQGHTLEEARKHHLVAERALHAHAWEERPNGQ